MLRIHRRRGFILPLAAPAEWSDFAGVKPSTDNSVAYPKGRIIMEEGAHLIVDGNLKAEGTHNEGSMLLATSYGPSQGMNRLVSVGGDVDLEYGMMPGVDLGDLVDKLAENNSTLRGFNDDFFTPYTRDIVPQAAKFPYVGPWQWRKSWFAKYATTFEFIPLLEEFGLGGPWPIPLPFPNCLRRVFKYVSRIYAVELNFTTGENFYTHSRLWLFGRGVSPVLLKVPPEKVAENLAEIRWKKISLGALEEEMKDFLTEAMPEFAEKLIKEVIVDIVKQMVESLIPFKPPSCGTKKEEDEHEGEKGVEEEIKEKIEEFFADALKEFGGIIAKTFKAVLLDIKNDFYNEMNEGDGENSILREVPGVVLLSKGNINVGTAETSRLGLGLLIAKGNVTVGADKMVGSVVSLEGDIEVKELLHFPYFDRVSLYSPHKHKNLVESLVDFTEAEGALVGDVAKTYPRRIAEGWTKK